MPASKPTDLPQWASDATGGTPQNVVEPNAGKKAIGFVEEEKPPAEYVNWIWRIIFLWVLWLRDFEANAHTWLAAQVFSAVVQFSQAVTFVVAPILQAGAFAFGRQGFRFPYGFPNKPTFSFQENWLGYMVATVQPTAPWHVVSVAADASSKVETSKVNGNDNSTGARIFPGANNGNDIWLITGVDNGGPAYAYSGAFFDSGTSVNWQYQSQLRWRAALQTAVGNNATYYMGWTDSSETNKAFKNNVATGSFAAFRKASAQTSWDCVTADGSAETVTSSGVVVGDGERHVFEIVFDTDVGGPTVAFYIDGVLKAVHSTHLPALGLRLGFGGKATAASANPYLFIGPVSEDHDLSGLYA